MNTLKYCYQCKRSSICEWT